MKYAISIYMLYNMIYACKNQKLILYNYLQIYENKRRTDKKFAVSSL